MKEQVAAFPTESAQPRTRFRRLREHLNHCILGQEILTFSELSALSPQMFDWQDWYMFHERQLAEAADRTAVDERQVLELAVALVDPELVWHLVVGYIEIEPTAVVEVANNDTQELMFGINALASRAQSLAQHLTEEGAAACSVEP